MTRLRALHWPLVLLAAALVVVSCGGRSTPSTDPGRAPIPIGAVFPLAGATGGLARDELEGLRIAADLVNADGGVGGRPIDLRVHELDSGQDAPSVMRTIAAEGARVVVGSYASDLSIAASTAADAAGLVYWEAGAVADRLTGRGLPSVFRVGASGTNLGTNSAAFAATELASRLGRTASSLRLAIVSASDAYAMSVADAASGQAAADGVPVVVRATYNLLAPDWDVVMGELRAARPDVVILASHIPDGIAFRRAMVAADLHVGALIGSTMAECDPDFAGELGPDAVGVFASDRPTGGFDPAALDPTARIVYDRFDTAWTAASVRAGGTAPSAGAPSTADDWSGEYGDADAEYTTTGPDGLPTAEAAEEALAGFTAGWALFHHLLPVVGTDLDSASAIEAAARGLDLPTGSLPNGAGLSFSTDADRLGQNVRAAAVIWQWQAVRHYEFVWPPTYATATIGFVPLAR
jgi:branched-chain amino acid transport system substrate-binding protein